MPDNSRYLDLFLQESTEHLEQIGNELVTLEKSGASEAVDAIFRHAHSVKGMAASMGYTPIEKLSHGLEDFMDALRTTGKKPAAADVDAALAVADALTTLVNAVAEGQDLAGVPVDIDALGRKLAGARALILGGRPDARPDAPAEETDTPADDNGGAIPNLKVIVQIVGTSKVPGVRGFLVHKRLSGIGTVLHCEPPLSDLKAGRIPKNRMEVLLSTGVPPDKVEAMLQTISELESVETGPASLEDLATDPTAPKAAAPGPTGQARGRTVRIRTDLLDGFMDSVGELLLATERIRSLAVVKSDEGPTPVEEAVDRLSRIARDLHAQVMATRMTPVATLTDQLPRRLREISRKLGKQVELTVKGADIELDRAILDEIDASLTHIVRNCVDHGLESPKEREAAGKSPTGHLKVIAGRDRDSVVIEVADDGRGLDREKLVSAAVAAGHLSAAAGEALPDKDAWMLVCLPGLSTRDEVTDVSGRGVGMDAVRDTVTALGGGLSIHSDPGRGTRFILRLPLTIAVQRLLLVTLADQVFGVPVNKVVQVGELAEDRITRARGRPMMPYQDRFVPVMDLATSLTMPSGRTNGTGACVVAETRGDGQVAVLVDDLAGQVEAVIKPLGAPLESIRGLAGATLLPDGRPIFVLDLASLAAAGEHGSPVVA